MLPIQVCDTEKYLYHFTSAETALLYILPSMKLKFSSFIKTNDEMEKHSIGQWEIFSELEPFTQVEVGKEFNKQISENIRIICLSTDFKVGDMYISGYKHPLLWSHYTDRNSGVCLVLNKELLISEAKTSPIYLRKVKYSNFRKLPKFELSVNGNIRKSVMKYIHNNMSSLFFLKHKHWKFEHEFRIISTRHSEFIDISKSLSKIILGPEFNKEYFNAINKLIPSEQISNLMISWSGFTEIPAH